MFQMYHKANTLEIARQPDTLRLKYTMPTNEVKTMIIAMLEPNQRVALFFPYERNTKQVQMPTPVGSGGLG
jgi:hypothetical protein